MTGNAAYPAPTPTMPVFKTAIDALANANAAVDKNPGPTEHQARRMAKKTIRALLKTLSGYVQMASGGDQNTILSSGFGVAKRGGPIGELNPPKDLAQRHTSVTGRAAIKWTPDLGADIYQVFMSSKNDPFAWVLVGATTKSRFNMEKLTPRDLYWFAVTAIGAAGETSLSEPLLVMAAA